MGGGFPRNGPVSHQPAQEVAASCPARRLTTGPQLGPQSKKPFTPALQAGRGPGHQSSPGAQSGGQTRECLALGDPGASVGLGERREAPLGVVCGRKSSPKGTVCGSPEVTGAYSSARGARLGPTGSEALETLAPGTGSSRCSQAEGVSQEAEMRPRGAAGVPQPTSRPPNYKFGHVCQRNQRGAVRSPRPHSSVEAASTDRNPGPSASRPLFPLACWNLPGSR